MSGDTVIKNGITENSAGVHTFVLRVYLTYLLWKYCQRPYAPVQVLICRKLISDWLLILLHSHVRKFTSIGEAIALFPSMAIPKRVQSSYFKYRSPNSRPILQSTSENIVITTRVYLWQVFSCCSSILNEKFLSVKCHAWIYMIKASNNSYVTIHILISKL